MQQLNQIIETNVNVKKLNLNNVKRSNVTGADVQRVAQYIAQKLDDYKSINFFCKVAWQIPEHKLMNILESALRGHSPQRLFTYLCNIELRKLNSAS